MHEAARRPAHTTVGRKCRGGRDRRGGGGGKGGSECKVEFFFLFCWLLAIFQPPPSCTSQHSEVCNMETMVNMMVRRMVIAVAVIFPTTTIAGAASAVVKKLEDLRNSPRHRYINGGST